MGESRMMTYCNPMDLPYAFATEGGNYREAADPTMMIYGGAYWLFPSKSGGYYHSADLLHWEFVAGMGYPVEAYAPTTLEIDGKVYLTAIDIPTLYAADDLHAGTWTEAADFGRSFPDPALFLDDDGRLYMYSGCSDKDLLQGSELDPQNGFKVLQTIEVPESRRPEIRGWEVPGDRNENTRSVSWIEGPWMNKHNGKYYLQYAAPGTEFKSYGDGVLVGDRPLGPFTYAPYSPFSFKPTGFIAGAGHGSTLIGLDGLWWHVTTMTVSTRHIFERRLGLFPTWFTPAGELVSDTYLGDYPHYIGGSRGLVGWMLLSRAKPVTASSFMPDRVPQNAVDEEVRTWWSAASGDPGEWLAIDLGGAKRVEAIQINFADEGSTVQGRSAEGYRYLLAASQDGKEWNTIVDRSQKGRDAPHDYIVLPQTVVARFIRLTNMYSPNGAKFSLSGLRVFGSGDGASPDRVEAVTATRDLADPRRATIQWTPVGGAEFYIVRLGPGPDTMTQNYQIYSGSTAEICSLTAGVRYQVTIDAVNENGVTPGVVRIELP